MRASGNNISVHIHDDNIQVEPPILDRLGTRPHVNPFVLPILELLFDVEIQSDRGVPEQFVVRERDRFLVLLRSPGLNNVRETVRHKTQRRIREALPGNQPNPRLFHTASWLTPSRRENFNVRLSPRVGVRSRAGRLRPQRPIGILSAGHLHEVYWWCGRVEGPTGGQA